MWSKAKLLLAGLAAAIAAFLVGLFLANRRQRQSEGVIRDSAQLETNLQHAAEAQARVGQVAAQLEALKSQPAPTTKGLSDEEVADQLARRGLR